MSRCQVYPRRIAAIFSCFTALCCTQLPLYAFAACVCLQLRYLFVCPDHQTFAQPASQWLCKHSEDLECVCFSLVCFLSATYLRGDKDCCY